MSVEKPSFFFKQYYKNLTLVYYGEYDDSIFAVRCDTTLWRTEMWQT